MTQILGKSNKSARFFSLIINSLQGKLEDAEKGVAILGGVQ
jgi:hypothetical protein